MRLGHVLSEDCTPISEDECGPASSTASRGQWQNAQKDKFSVKYGHWTGSFALAWTASVTRANIKKEPWVKVLGFISRKGFYLTPAIVIPAVDAYLSISWVEFYIDKSPLI